MNAFFELPRTPNVYKSIPKAVSSRSYLKPVMNNILIEYYSMIMQVTPIANLKVLLPSPLSQRTLIQIDDYWKGVKDDEDVWDLLNHLLVFENRSYIARKQGDKLIMVEGFPWPHHIFRPFQADTKECPPRFVESKTIDVYDMGFKRVLQMQ